jgi:hypothetical protein
MDSNHASVVVTIVLLVVLAIVGLYDVYAIIKWGDAYSVTFVIRKWNAEFPVMGLLVGIVLGHLFWCKSCVEIEVKIPPESVKKSTIVPVVDHTGVSDADS